MLISNEHSDYLVIQHVQSTPEWESYLCQKIPSTSDVRYDVLCVKDMTLCCKLIERFVPEVNAKKFSDFVEAFTFACQLVLVFFHSTGMPLKEKLSEQHCPFTERLELAHNLLERMVYLQMPVYFQVDALQGEHILVEHGQEIRFRYGFTQLGKLNTCTIQDVGNGVGLALNQLFTLELQQQTCPELSAFLQWLKQGEYQSYLDLYERFIPYYQVLQNKSEQELTSPHTPFFRLWKKIKIGIHWLKKILMVALVIGALVYLLYSVAEYCFLSDPSEVSAAPGPFEQIGTVKIQGKDVIYGE